MMQSPGHQEPAVMALLLPAMTVKGHQRRILILKENSVPLLIRTKPKKCTQAIAEKNTSLPRGKKEEADLTKTNLILHAAVVMVEKKDLITGNPQVTAKDPKGLQQDQETPIRIQTGKETTTEEIRMTDVLRIGHTLKEEAARQKGNPILPNVNQGIPVILPLRAGEPAGKDLQMIVVPHQTNPIQNEKAVQQKGRIVPNADQGVQKILIPAAQKETKKIRSRSNEKNT